MEGLFVGLGYWYVGKVVHVLVLYGGLCTSYLGLLGGEVGVV